MNQKRALEYVVDSFKNHSLWVQECNFVVYVFVDLKKSPSSHVPILDSLILEIPKIPFRELLSLDCHMVLMW